MRLLYMGNNRVGWQVLRYLKERGEDIAGLVLHPQDKRSYGREMVEVCNLDNDRIFDGSRLGEPDTINRIIALKPDLGLSVFFGYILNKDFIDRFPVGVLNLHPSYLPYNRGAYPNVWSIVDGTPAGATLHYLDEGVDTGDIVAREQVPVDGTDTGATLYRKLERACVDLFAKHWPAVREGNAERIKNETPGTFHRVKDAESLDRLELERHFTARELIDIIRARTFPPHKGAYFVSNGERIYLRLTLLRENEMEGQS